MANAKLRHKDLKQFSREAFKGTFYYSIITDILPTAAFIPTSTKSFIITFSRNLNEFQRDEVENIVYRWFRVGTHFQHQGIICWREGYLILSIF